MLASILWQGSLPEEDEINQMKEEGYLRQYAFRKLL